MSLRIFSLSLDAIYPSLSQTVTHYCRLSDGLGVIHHRSANWRFHVRPLDSRSSGSYPHRSVSFSGPRIAPRQSSAVHGVVITAYVIAGILVLLLPLCCYRSYFRSLYSRSTSSQLFVLPFLISVLLAVFNSRRRHSQLPLPEEESDIIQTSSVRPTISRAIIPGPLPAGTVPQPKFSRKVSSPLPVSVKTPPARAPVPPPTAPDPPAARVTGGPQSSPSNPPSAPATPRAPDPTPSSRSPPQPQSSPANIHPATVSAPTPPPKSHYESPVSVSPPTATPLESPAAPPTTSPLPKSMPPPTVRQSFSEGTTTRSRPSPHRPPRTRYPNPDELRAIDILASLSPTQRTTILESHQAPAQTTSRPSTDSSPRTSLITQIRLPNPSPGQTSAMKVLNAQTDPDRRKTLVHALLLHGKGTDGAPAAPSGATAHSELIDVPLPPASQVITPRASRASVARSTRTSDSEELSAIDLLSSMNPSRRSGFFASALRQNEGSQASSGSGSSAVRGYGSSSSSSPSPRIDRQRLSPEKVAIAEVLESMSADQRRSLVADVLKRGSQAPSVSSLGYEF